MRSLDKCVLCTFITLTILYFIVSLRMVDVNPSTMEEKANTHSANLTPEYVYKPNEALQRRAHRINDVCRANPALSSYTPKRKPHTEDWVYNAYLKQDQVSLLYCPVPKCGWSSWRSMLFKALYDKDKEAEMKYILEDMKNTGWQTPWHKIRMSKHLLLDGRQLMSAQNASRHRLIFVRDPYDRLVSAYKDKAMRNDGAYTKREKLPCKWIRDDSPILTFSQFITCILENAEERSRNDLSSFSAGELLDMHWRPQSLLCNVCTINFNIIGHFDHMNEDIGEALKILKIDTKPLWTNVAGVRKPLSKYYNQLNKQQLKDLQLLYKYDFELFDFEKSPPILTGH